MVELNTSKEVQVGEHTVIVPLMLTVPQASKIYGLSRHLLYDLARTGKVKAVQSGVKFLINAESLTDYLRNATITGNQPKTATGMPRID